MTICCRMHRSESYKKSRLCCFEAQPFLQSTEMKFQIFIILGLAATATMAVPNMMALRQAVSSTTAMPSCPDGLGSTEELLTVVGNILDNIVANVQQIKLAGADNPRNIVNLEMLITQLRNLLIDMLGDGNIDNDQRHYPRMLSLVDNINSALDNILGPGTGQNFSCTPDGVISLLLGTLANNVIVQSLTQVIGHVNNLLLTL